MNTVDKTPEQIDFYEKIKKAIAETPAHNWYRGSDSPDIFERQLLPEPDYRQIAATEAGKIPHGSVQEYLTDCDKIYNWLMTDEIKRLKRRYPITPDIAFNVRESNA